MKEPVGKYVKAHCTEKANFKLVEEIYIFSYSAMFFPFKKYRNS